MLGGQEFSDAAGGVTGTVEPLTLAWLNWSKVTYGLFGCAIIFDLIGVISDTDPFFFTASFWLLTAALASCLTPFLKWFRRNTPERTSERKRQFWHYLPQMLVTALFAMSWFLRYSFPTSPPTSALLLSFAPAAIALALTWFDGTLARCLRSLPTAAIVALAVLVAGIVSINLAQSAFFNRPEHDDSILTLRGHRGMVECVAFSPDGKRIASGGWDGTVRLWDRNTGAETGVLRGHRDRIMAITFSPNGRWLVSGSKDRTARVWEASSGRLSHVLAAHRDRVTTLAFSPDGSLLATGSRDKTIKLWDTNSWHEMRTLEGHEDFVWSVVFRPDGRVLASGSWDGTIRLWDVTGSDKPKALVDNGPIYSVAFCPDGGRIASGGERHITVWDSSTGNRVNVVPGPSASVVFSGDGDKLYSASGRTIEIWEPRTGVLLRTLLGHYDGVNAVQLSPDKDWLVSASHDGSVKVWPATFRAEKTSFR